MIERLQGVGAVFQCVALLMLSLNGSHRDLRQRVALGFTVLALACWLLGAPWLRGGL